MKKKVIISKGILKETNRTDYDKETEKELTKIYSSLVKIAKGYKEISVNIPNGIWKFKQN